VDFPESLGSHIDMDVSRAPDRREDGAVVEDLLDLRQGFIQLLNFNRLLQDVFVPMGMLPQRTFLLVYPEDTGGRYQGSFQFNLKSQITTGSLTIELVERGIKRVL